MGALVTVGMDVAASVAVISTETAEAVGSIGDGRAVGAQAAVNRTKSRAVCLFMVLRVSGLTALPAPELVPVLLEHCSKWAKPNHRIAGAHPTRDD